MNESRAQNYIERLPEILEREEADISHLDETMVEILYPERASKDFTITLSFSSPRLDRIASPEEQTRRLEGFEQAVALAQKGPDYRSESELGVTRHHARFGVDRVNALLELFTLLEDDPDAEVLVKNKKIPLARELWLPFFWFFVKDPPE